jgi:hypothetical protein
VELNFEINFRLNRNFSHSISAVLKPCFMIFKGNFLKKTALFACLALNSLGARAQIWQVQAGANMPEAVTNNAISEGFNGDSTFVYSFGGLDSTKLFSGIHRRCYRLDTRRNSWARLPDLPDTLGKIAAAASRVKNDIYIFGGYHVYANGDEKSSNRVHRFSVAQNRFLPDGVAIPVPIDDHVQAVWRDSLVFLVTGWSNTANVPTVQIYNPSANAWLSGAAVPNNNTYKSFGATGLIVGDTLFYFGGASMGTNFPAQLVIRKGVINVANPSQITWSSEVILLAAYRAVAAAVGKNLFFIGGSETTYNYNGIAYNGSGGVSPSGRILRRNLENSRFTEQISPVLPMDLRGIATISDSVRYLVGGMATGQMVSRRVLKLTLSAATSSNSSQHLGQKMFKIYPNPVIDTLFIEKNERDISDFECRFFAADGRLVATYKNPEQIVVRDFMPGVYFLECTESSGVVFTTQIVVR